MKLKSMLDIYDVKKDGMKNKRTNYKKTYFRAISLPISTQRLWNALQVGLLQTENIDINELRKNNKKRLRKKK